MPETDVENLLEACEQDLKSTKPEVLLAAVGRLRTLGEPAIPLLLSAAKDHEAKISEAATHALNDMGETGMLALRDLLYDDIQSRKKSKRTNFTIVLICLLCMVLAHCLEDIASAYPIIRNSISSASPIFGVALGAAWVRNKIHIQRGVIVALQKTDDVKYLGLFALCINEKDKEIRSGCERRNDAIDAPCSGKRRAISKCR